MQIFLPHVVFYMSVLGIVSEIMEDEEFEKEKTNDEHHRRNHHIFSDIDIVDTVDDAGYDNTKPKPLYTLHTGVSFPSKCFLTEREISWIIDQAEKSKTTTSVEWYTYHTKECVWEIPKDRSEHRIIYNRFVSLTSSGEIYHIFDIFCESKTERNESNAIHIVWDTFSPDSCTEQEPEKNKAYKSSSTHYQENCIRVSCTDHAVEKRSNHKEIDEDNWKTERLANTEDKECQFCELFEKCQEENDSILCVFCREIKSSEIVFEITDKVIPLDIEIEKEERYFFSTSRILYRPVKWQKNTSNNDNTREKESETLPERDFAIPHDEAAIEEGSDTSNRQRNPESCNKICDKWNMHNLLNGIGNRIWFLYTRSVLNTHADSIGAWCGEFMDDTFSGFLS